MGAKSKPGRLKPADAIGWQAIAKHAQGETERDSLPVGGHAVDLRVTGTVAGSPFAGRIAGTLDVGPDSTRNVSEAPAAELVVAWLLDELAEDDEARTAVLRRLPKVWADELPALPAAEVQQAKQLLERLRRRAGTAPKRGDVRFTPTAQT